MNLPMIQSLGKQEGEDMVSFFIRLELGINQEGVSLKCRGNMENFIKESKNGFNFGAVCNHSKLANANRL